MSTIKQVVGTRTSQSISGLSTLASATYLASSDITPTAGAVDVIVEPEVGTSNTPSGNKQILVYSQACWDGGGSNYQSGPTNGTTDTAAPLLTLLGAIGPVGSGSTRKGFSLAAAYGGVCPPQFRVIIKNDLGVALTIGSLYTTDITATVT